MAIRDTLEGTKDYRLKVAAVDLDDVQEREANILLNNANAGGDYDLEKLTELMKTPGLDLDGTGFDAADIYRLIGEDPLLAVDDAVDELAEKLRSASEAYSKVREKSRDRDGTDFFTVLVWRDDAARDEAHAALGFDENRYQDGRAVLEKLKGEGEDR